MWGRGSPTFRGFLFIMRARIDPNHHKGIIVTEDTTGGALDVTGAELTNSHPMHVAIVDGLGNQVTSFGSAPTYITVLRVDTADPETTYIGKAVPGTATSDAAWQIASLDENTNVDLLYADGGAFTQIYDNRESLTYA